MSHSKAPSTILPVGIVVIGTGQRAIGVVEHLIRDSGGQVRILSMYDPDPGAMEEAATAWKATDALRARSAEEALEVPGAQWAMIFSPNAFHREHIERAFDAGLHVFAEKPLATTIEDCVAIHEAHRRSHRFFATGFVLRYAPLYREIKRLLDTGTFGPVISIAANENIPPDHGGYIMSNWRRLTRWAGPHILEKCCHDLDLINWFCDDLPRRAAAFHDLLVYRPENQWMFDRYGGADRFLTWRDRHRVGSPFTSDKDITDTFVGILDYRKGAKVMFQATMCNAIPERRMYIACREGTIIAELYRGTLQYARIGESPREVQLSGGGHGGGDDFIMKELWDTMTQGTPPACSGEEGLRSAVVALALDQAAREGRVVDLEPTWAALGR